jgi:hypothetical protein
LFIGGGLYSNSTNQLNNWFNNQSVALSDIIFIRQWSDILLRIDANYYAEKYIQFEQKILNTIKTGKYRLYKLKDLLLTLKTGTTPKTSDEPYTNESNNIPFLRNTNLTSRGISLENMKYIKNYVIHIKIMVEQLYFKIYLNQMIMALFYF